MSITPGKYTNTQLFFIFVRIKTGKFMNRTCEQTEIDRFFGETQETNFLCKKLVILFFKKFSILIYIVI